MQYLMPIGIGGGIGIAIVIAVLVYKKFSKGEKTKILYFDTDKTCKLKTMDSKEGKVKFDKKTWNITKENAYMFKERKNVFPFMVLTHDSSKSVDVMAKKVKGVKPEEMSSLLNMNVLKMLLEPTGIMGGKFAIGFSIIMLCFGMCIGVVLVSVGIITV